VKAFSNTLERHLAEVGLHGQYGLALHLRECRAVEGSRELEVGKRCSGVLVLIHLVVAWDTYKNPKKSVFIRSRKEKDAYTRTPLLNSFLGS